MTYRRTLVLLLFTLTACPAPEPTAFPPGDASPSSDNPPGPGAGVVVSQQAADDLVERVLNLLLFDRRWPLDEARSLLPIEPGGGCPTAETASVWDDGCPWDVPGCDLTGEAHAWEGACTDAEGLDRTGAWEWRDGEARGSGDGPIYFGAVNALDASFTTSDDAGARAVEGTIWTWDQFIEQESSEEEAWRDRSLSVVVEAPGPGVSLVNWNGGRFTADLESSVWGLRDPVRADEYSFDGLFVFEVPGSTWTLTFDDVYARSVPGDDVAEGRGEAVVTVVDTTGRILVERTFRWTDESVAAGCIELVSGDCLPDPLIEPSR